MRIGLVKLPVRRNLYQQEEQSKTFKIPTIPVHHQKTDLVVL